MSECEYIPSPSAAKAVPKGEGARIERRGEGRESKDYWILGSSPEGKESIDIVSSEGIHRQESSPKKAPFGAFFISFFLRCILRVYVT